MSTSKHVVEIHIKQHVFSRPYDTEADARLAVERLRMFDVSDARYVRDGVTVMTTEDLEDRSGLHERADWDYDDTYCVDLIGPFEPIVWPTADL